MIFRALSGTNDWTFGAGKANYATDDNAIAFNLATRLRSWKNDCFFDFDMGIDWLARLDKGQKEYLLNDLKQLIIQTYGIMRITSVDITEDPATRAILITYTVDTIFSKNFTNAVALAAGAPAGN